jgi:hypothetical protein
LTTDFKYVKFYSPWLTLEKKKRIESFWIYVLKFINWFFIPKDNPDFDKLIDDVAEWLVEIDTNTNKAKRQIGVDISGQIIMKMPWLENKGFWHSNLFDRFNPVTIDKTMFETKWNAFVELPSKK